MTLIGEVRLRLARLLREADFFPSEKHDLGRVRSDNLREPYQVFFAQALAIHLT